MKMSPLTKLQECKEDNENDTFDEITGVQDVNENNHEIMKSITKIMTVTTGMITTRMVVEMKMVETILTILKLQMKLPLKSLVMAILPQFMMTILLQFRMKLQTMNT